MRPLMWGIEEQESGVGVVRRDLWGIIGIVEG